MVDPSSAPRSCSSVYLTSVRPHFSQRASVVASSCTMLRSSALTLDWSFCRSAEGKSRGCVRDSIVGAGRSGKGVRCR
jgi:hypothetical protein